MFTTKEGILGNFRIGVSADGRRAFGCNFLNKENEENEVRRTLESEQEIEELNPLRFNANRIRLKEDEYDETIAQLSQLEKELIGLEKKKAKIATERSRLKRGYPALITAWVGFGAYLGLVAAVDVVLDWHGPTITLFGTILATIFYAASAIGMALACTWLGKNTSQILCDGMRDEAKAYTAEITAVQEEIEELRHRASRLAEQAWSNQI